MIRSEDFQIALSSSGDPSEAVSQIARPVGAFSRKMLPKIISLFSGAGGLDLGFKEAGFTISVAIDAADAAIRTHKKNFPRTKAVVGDLIKLRPEGVVERVKKALEPK